MHSLNIKSVTILKRKGFTDEITVITDLPSPFICAPEHMNLKCALKFETPRGRGIAYVEKHFPNITTKIIDIDNL